MVVMMLLLIFLLKVILGLILTTIILKYSIMLKIQGRLYLLTMTLITKAIATIVVKQLV